MKKSELTQLTQIIEYLVAKEVKKQLPAVIAEVFQKMMNKPVITETKNETEEPDQQNVREQIETETLMKKNELKASLKELFNGPLITKNKLETEDVCQPKRRSIKQYTKDPVLNQILNETVGDLRQRESLVGAAAFQGGYSPAMAMVPGFNAGAVTGPGQMMDASEEPAFSKNMPTMPGQPQSLQSLPGSRPVVLTEGQESTHTPLSELPQGMSALDVIKQVPAPAAVTKALTRNYSQMLKLIDKKKGKA